MLYIAENNRCF